MAPILRKLTKLNKTVHAEFADRYDELREELNEWSERFNALAQEVESELDERAPNLDEVDWPEPREADRSAFYREPHNLPVGRWPAVRGTPGRPEKIERWRPTDLGCERSPGMRPQMRRVAP